MSILRHQLDVIIVTLRTMIACSVLAVTLHTILQLQGFKVSILLHLMATGAVGQLRQSQMGYMIETRKLAFGRVALFGPP